MSKNSILITICLALGILHSSAVAANELLMIDDEFCTWCHKWEKEIGVIFNLTPESCQAPLRRVDIDDDLPKTLKIGDPVQYTPTFILIHQQEEVGRITGYPGEEFFWAMLNELLVENIPELDRNQILDHCPHSG